VPKPETQSQPKVRSIKLTTETTPLGDDCVRRDPSTLKANRKDVDIIRVINGNTSGSGQAITVTINPSKAAALFDPVPAAEMALDPGESVDWRVSASIAGSAGVKFQTDPDSCTGHDQDDITISC
jgi:hypothetical protein